MLLLLKFSLNSNYPETTETDYGGRHFCASKWRALILYRVGKRVEAYCEPEIVGQSKGLKLLAAILEID